MLKDTLMCHQFASARKLDGLASKAISRFAVINIVTIGLNIAEASIFINQRGHVRILRKLPGCPRLKIHHHAVCLIVWVGRAAEHSTIVQIERDLTNSVCQYRSFQKLILCIQSKVPAILLRHAPTITGYLHQSLGTSSLYQLCIFKACFRSRIGNIEHGA